MSLAHKGLDYRRVPTPFTSVPAVEGGVSKTVPVIRDGDKVVADSFTIALYLDEAYPDRPTLFGGEGGKAMARFIERWSQLTLHPYLGAAALTDIHARLAPPDQAYFRENREQRYGKTLGGGLGRRDAGPRGLPRVARTAAQHADLPALHRRQRAALSGLHRLRRVPVGARHVALPDAGEGRSRCRMVRALPRSPRRARAKRAAAA